MKISAIVKDPGEKPRHVNIENTLENFQRTVGGYIECIPVHGYKEDGQIVRIEMILNEEGKLLGLDPNFWLDPGEAFQDLIRGTVVFVGVDGDEFGDIPLSFAEFKQNFPRLFDERSGYGSSL